MLKKFCLFKYSFYYFKFGDEGGATIQDLIVDSDGIKLVEDNTRDGYSSQEDRIVSQYKIVDIYTESLSGWIQYYVKTDQGVEKFLYSAKAH